MRVAKAHGLGNDFIIVADRDAGTVSPRWVERLCDRHAGVGADGVLVYALRDESVAMRLFNADGGEVEISGNGLRCLSAYVFSKGWLPARHVVETGAGPRTAKVERLDGPRFRIETDLGAPILSSSQIPIDLDPPLAQVVDFPLEAAGRQMQVTATSLGNPHCAVFLASPPDDTSLTAIGSALERHPSFPRRTNVEFVTVVSESRLRVRFWERGVGLTQASGTGAASAAVAAILSGRAGRKLEVECDGGVLEVAWPSDGHVTQIGEVELILEGDWLAPKPPG
jgi:diaminopimelate epimerase